MNDAEIVQVTQDLKHNFSLDNRFVYHGYVASGSYGSAHRIQYINHERGTRADFLIKVSFGSLDARGFLRDEKEYLQQVRGGMHMVQVIDLQDHPLAPDRFRWEWTALEWLPNGTIGTFVARAKLHGLQRLPNRLLWRFFLCMIRSCCGLAWPRNRQDNLVEIELPIEGVEPGGLAHNDLHSENVLLGDFGYGEHNISPILKIIDFGLTSEYEPGEREAAKNTNLFELGMLMIMLITLEYHFRMEMDPVWMTHDNEDIETYAASILPREDDMPRPFPWLDPWLATIIGLCLATEVNIHQIPSLEQLSTWVSIAVLERTTAFYHDFNESDAVIREICEKIVLNPP
ncbi:uncharacterized protein F4807DRAFT_444127 [Annulohypoxylon truncatum]|uniref:uncharacterized protein n=1 Tax=Annulohypoxylon truncatum TaxID=327061 RepID=UPI002007282A|nr:uncharacterized protein F4807DRAFT_444127 [Annulohypoxylon truncatum]KAI1205129.1 hypothetical protein F4807DRAFT_444127 [Annulohypoxylon truncatum]